MHVLCSITRELAVVLETLISETSAEVPVLRFVLVSPARRARRVLRDSAEANTQVITPTALSHGVLRAWARLTVIHRACEY